MEGNPANRVIDATSPAGVSVKSRITVITAQAASLGPYICLLSLVSSGSTSRCTLRTIPDTGPTPCCNLRGVKMCFFKTEDKGRWDHIKMVNKLEKHLYCQHVKMP